MFGIPIYRENSTTIYFYLLFMIKTEELWGMVRLATRFLGLSEGAQWPTNVFSGDGGGKTRPSSGLKEDERWK